MMISIVVGLLCSCSVGLAETIWKDAGTMRRDVERIVLDRAKSVENSYKGVSQVRA